MKCLAHILIESVKQYNEALRTFVDGTHTTKEAEEVYNNRSEALSMVVMGLELDLWEDKNDFFTDEMDWKEYKRLCVNIVAVTDQWRESLMERMKGSLDDDARCKVIFKKISKRLRTSRDELSMHVNDHFKHSQKQKG